MCCCLFHLCSHQRVHSSWNVKVISVILPWTDNTYAFLEQPWHFLECIHFGLPDIEWAEIFLFLYWESRILLFQITINTFSSLGDNAFLKYALWLWGHLTNYSCLSCIGFWAACGQVWVCGLRAILPQALHDDQPWPPDACCLPHAGNRPQPGTTCSNPSLSFPVGLCYHGCKMWIWRCHAELGQGLYPYWPRPSGSDGLPWLGLWFEQGIYRNICGTDEMPSVRMSQCGWDDPSGS